jgi:heme A synthase
MFWPFSLYKFDHFRKHIWQENSENQHVEVLNTILASLLIYQAIIGFLKSWSGPLPEDGFELLRGSGTYFLNIAVLGHWALN